MELHRWMDRPSVPGGPEAGANEQPKRRRRPRARPRGPTNQPLSIGCVRRRGRDTGAGRPCLPRERQRDNAAVPRG
jgi:hypothetical protein